MNTRNLLIYILNNYAYKFILSIINNNYLIYIYIYIYIFFFFFFK